MNTLNGSKLHLARNDKRYAVCRRNPIHGAVELEDFMDIYKTVSDSGKHGFCKICLKRALENI